ncbi:MAG: tetratricopeptide repeat protein [Planctomycetota bacterium]|jgi:tetratricopeptide (TPR) repeat protein
MLKKSILIVLAGFFLFSISALGEDKKGTESAYDRAFRLYSEGKFKEAEAAYRKALQESPESIGVNLELGRLLRELNRASEAIPFLEKAHKLAPSLGAVAAELGTAHLALEEWDDAKKYLEKATKLNAKDAFSWWRLGYVHYRKEKLPEAEKALSRAVSLDPELAMAWLDLGFVLRKKGEGEKAVKCFRSALECDPGSALAFKEYSATVEKFGDEREKTYLKGLKAHNGGKYKDAEVWVRTLLEGDPKDARCQFLLGHILLHQDPPKAKEAIEAYEKAFSLDGKAPRKARLPLRSRSYALEGLGIAALLADDLKKAKKTFTSGAKLEKDYPGHFYYLAVVAARESKTSDLWKRLQAVFERDRDGSWVKRAKEDKEFEKFRDEKAFREALAGKRGGRR